MFGKGKRERERGRQAAAEAFAILDELLEFELKVRSGEVSADPTRYSTVGIVERLLPICRNDPNAVVDVIGLWSERYEGDPDNDEPDPRESAAGAIMLGVGLGGVGNLFGFIPSDAPAFTADLAAEGRARGWRE
jgi:hypothetical protein